MFRKAITSFFFKAGCLMLPAVMLLAVRSLAAPAADFLSRDYTKERITASYGVISALEPQVAEAEGRFIKSIADELANDPASALEAVKGHVTEKSSAALDFILGNLYFQKDDYTNAKIAYQNALRKFPDFRRAWKNLGLLECRTENHDAAIAALSRALNLGDVDSKTYGLLGYAYAQKAQWLSAETAYRQAILCEPDNDDWRLGLAYALSLTQREKEAVALFDELIQRNPARETFWLYQANALLASEQPMKAAENIEVVRALGKANANSLKLLAAIYFNEGLHTRSLAVYREIFSTVASESDRDALLEVTERFALAEAFGEANTLAEILRKQSALLNEKQTLRLDTVTAKTAYASGKTEQAESLFRSVLERDPLNGDALLTLADIELAKGNTEQAKLFLERAVKQNAFVYRGSIKLTQVFVNEGNYAEALTWAEKALAANRNKALEDYCAKLRQLTAAN